MEKFIIKTVSSIEKIRKYTQPKTEATSGVCFQNARHNFQLAFCSLERLRKCRVRIEGTLADRVQMRIVEDVAVKYTYVFDANGDDDFVLSQEAGLFPDILRPYETYDLSVFPKQWNSVWLTVTGEDIPLPAGTHTLTFIVQNEDGELGRATYTLTVLDKTLPKLDIFNTNWLHYDCLAEWYGLEVFSDRYYPLLNAYISNMVSHGVNTLLTPLFTPPLDTGVGAERLTVQLVDIQKQGSMYAFNFEKLDKFIDNAFALGIEKLEFSHLFTQWGGLYCPKIVAQTENGLEKIFGWETPSESAEYVAFLQAFLPALVAYIDKKGIRDKCYFHLTDEPQEKDLEKYASLRKLVKGLIGDLPVIDALSEFRFAELVDIPVVDISCVKNFVGKCDRFGAYYFCGTSKNAPNRFIVHPALRTRMLGYEAYLHAFKGFLHWGFNFWKTEHSVKNIDPYFVNDAGGAFPAGDPFTVYPDGNGPLDSIRNEIVSDGWTDYRELLLAQSYVGRDAVVKVLQKYGVKTVNEYVLEEENYLAMRAEILSLIP